LARVRQVVQAGRHPANASLKICDHSGGLNDAGHLTLDLLIWQLRLDALSPGITATPPVGIRLRLNLQAD